MTQLEILRRFQCDEFQGFLFSEAVPSAKVASILTANAHTRPAAVNNFAMVAGR
jgi:EAL domain-containing protein (putative c-di-GMP-specific phosphodiesterase class I)